MRAKRRPRFDVMSVPGHRDDGRDTWWYLCDWRTDARVEIGRGDRNRMRAYRMALAGNQEQPR